MTRFAVSILLCGLINHGAGAASFDCSKAATPTEHLICAEPALSRQDEQLADAYRAALKRAADPRVLRAKQLEWLKVQRDACGDSTCVMRVSAARISALGLGAAPDSALDSAFQEACPVLTQEARGTADDHCRVTASGPFGAMDNETFHYATYCLDSPHGEADRCGDSGIALFSASDGKVSRWRTHYGNSVNSYAAPVIHSTPQGTLLEIPIAVSGTGYFNESELFVRQDHRWIPVDTSPWAQDLRNRLPEGREAWKGIWPDWNTLSAQTPLWKPGDANCCPSAGSASIQLRLSGTRLEIESLQLSDRNYDE
ncbi:MAG: lysozyme inhibitor LprI family protein [Tahibacter sp.]